MFAIVVVSMHCVARGLGASFLYKCSGSLRLLVMAALCNRAGHYIFALWFLSSIYLSFLFFA